MADYYSINCFSFGCFPRFLSDMAKNKELILRAQNPIDLFKIVYDENIMEIILARLTQNQAFCARYLDDTEFRTEIDKLLLPLVHERLSKISELDTQ